MKKRIFALFLVLMTLMTTIPTAVYAAKKGTKVHYEHTFDSAPVSASFTDNTSGLGMSYATGKWKILSGKDAIKNRTPFINTADWRWWSVSYFEETMGFSFKTKTDATFNGTFLLSINTQDKGTSTEGLGGIVISIVGNGSDKITVKDFEGKTVATLDHGVHSFDVVMTRTEKNYTIKIDGKVVTKESEFKSETYNIYGMRIQVNANNGNSAIGFDDFKAYTVGRMPAQNNSYQERGDIPEVIIPAEKEDRIYAFVDRNEIDLTEKEATFANGTVFLPVDKTAIAAGLEVSTGESGQTILYGATVPVALKADNKTVRIGEKYIELKTAPKSVEGTLYAPLQFFAEALDAKVWYDEPSKTCVITTGDHKTDGILRSYNGKFFLNGEIYYEISFNKFDLNMQLSADPTLTGGGKKYSDATWNNAESCLAGAEKALKELSENGFKTIRVFCSNINLGKKSSEVKKFYKIVDKMYDLCDQYGIQVVACMSLWTEEFIPGAYIDGTWVHNTNENFYDYFTDENSQARANAYAFLKDYIDRYKDRKTILMWEIANEGSLQVDVGGATGGVSFSILQLAEFYNGFARKFHEYDPERLVTSGDGMLRNAQWGLFEGVMKGSGVNWAADTPEERLKAYTLLYEELDVICIHGYDVGVSSNNGHGIVNINGKDTRIDHAFYVQESERMNKPLYNGESGGQMGGSAGNTDPKAAKYRKRYLDDLIDGGVQLTHWWTYGSNRNGGFNNDFDSWNVTIQDTPETFETIKDANEKLKKKWIVNAVKDENTTLVSSGTFVDYSGADLDIPAPPTTETEASAPEKKGCFGSIATAALLGIAAGAVVLTKKKDD